VPLETVVRIDDLHNRAHLGQRFREFIDKHIANSELLTKLFFRYSYKFKDDIVYKTVPVSAVLDKLRKAFALDDFFELH
jgi:hypothetical protein